MPLTLLYITNSPAIASVAENAGVDRIMVDLETLGKAERQRHINSVKSQHSIHDIEVISHTLTKATMLVRINPINEGTEAEIEQVIDAGAEMIMLPMWKSAEDVKRFLALVRGRAKTTLLLETREAADCLDEVLAAGGFDEVHIGLNDLHLSYGLSFLFEPLSNGLVEKLCAKLQAFNIPYGFGGIARIGEGTLPAEKIVMEHYRLGSTRAILSRSFCNTEEIHDIKAVETIFTENMRRLRDFESSLSAVTDHEYEQNAEDVRHCVANIVSALSQRNRL